MSGHRRPGSHLADCTIGVIAIFAWPVMIFALVAMILEIVGAVKCMKAKADWRLEGNKQ